MNNFRYLLEECIAFLPESRRGKAKKLYNKNNAILSATAGLMMKKVLGITKDDMLGYGEHGKPYLKNGPFFSISHSRRYSVLAVSENEV
ncbi:MAG: hypothetical protein IIU57_05595, partial [Oscillospiraceae bacterium]|nr:hypothetical protein [Oscillospiraceae bacterium]